MRGRGDLVPRGDFEASLGDLLDSRGDLDETLRDFLSLGDFLSRGECVLELDLGDRNSFLSTGERASAT